MFNHIICTLNKLAEFHPPFMFDFMKLFPIELIISFLDEHFSGAPFAIDSSLIIQTGIHESWDREFDTIDFERRSTVENTKGNASVNDLSISEMTLNSSSRLQLLTSIDIFLQRLENILITEDGLFLPDSAVPHDTALNTLAVLTSKITPVEKSPSFQIVDGIMVSKQEGSYLSQMRSRKSTRPQLLQNLIKISATVSKSMRLFHQSLECIMNVLVYCRPVEITVASARIVSSSFKRCINNEVLSMFAQRIIDEYLNFHDVQSVNKVETNFVFFEPNKVRRDDRKQIRILFTSIREELVAAKCVASSATKPVAKPVAGGKVAKALGSPKTSKSSSLSPAQTKTSKSVVSISSERITASVNARSVARKIVSTAGITSRPLNKAVDHTKAVDHITAAESPRVLSSSKTVGRSKASSPSLRNSLNVFKVRDMDSNCQLSVWR
jgi:hypothetical protein